MSEENKVNEKLITRIEYDCAVDTLNNLREILNGDPLKILTPDEIKSWYAALDIINAYKLQHNLQR
ncbi:MAG: hypothetical protein ACOX7D_02830 [Alphaproteobacteria bacterium]|jgi:hypothetical protein